jgi:hypothetical protein
MTVVIAVSEGISFCQCISSLFLNVIITEIWSSVRLLFNFSLQVKFWPKRSLRQLEAGGGVFD